MKSDIMYRPMVNTALTNYMVFDRGVSGDQPFGYSCMLNLISECCLISSSLEDRHEIVSNSRCI